MSTTEDVIKSAASVARDVAEGRLDPAALDAAVAEECRELFGTVAGPVDPLWPLQVDVARQVLALGGVPADELTEWTAVVRRRAGQGSDTPGPSDDPGAAGTSASGAHSSDSGDIASDPEPGMGT
jgi:hypothetical protein